MRRHAVIAKTNLIVKATKHCNSIVKNQLTTVTSYQQNLENLKDVPVQGRGILLDHQGRLIWLYSEMVIQDEQFLCYLPQKLCLADVHLKISR